MEFSIADVLVSLAVELIFLSVIWFVVVGSPSRPSMSKEYRDHVERLADLNVGISPTIESSLVLSVAIAKTDEQREKAEARLSGYKQYVAHVSKLREQSDVVYVTAEVPMIHWDSYIERKETE